MSVNRRVFGIIIFLSGKKIGMENKEIKEVLVVGGSSGIGAETVALFLKKGYFVTNLSRGECKITGVRNIPCDVTDGEKLDTVLDKYLSDGKGLKTVVYSAGFSMAAPLEYAEEKDIKYLYEVNFFAFLKVLAKTLPYLKKSCGTFCVISSVGATVPIAYDAYYSSSKAAVNMAVKALRQELAPFNVRIISVMPGGTKTNFSFKRKIYPYSEVDGYAEDMNSAVKTLQGIEQKGMKPSAVAKTVYKKCTSKNAYSGIYAAGAINKILVAFTRILPQQLFAGLVSLAYFGKEKGE